MGIETGNVCMRLDYPSRISDMLTLNFRVIYFDLLCLCLFSRPDYLMLPRRHNPLLSDLDVSFSFPSYKIVPSEPVVPSSCYQTELSPGNLWQKRHTSGCSLMGGQLFPSN